MKASSSGDTENETIISDIFTQSEFDGPEYRTSKITRIIICSMTKPTGSQSKIQYFHKMLENDKDGKDRDVDAIYLTKLFEKQADEGLRDMEISQDVDYKAFIGTLKEDKGLMDYDSFLFVFLTYLGKDDQGGGDVKIHFQDAIVSLREVQDELKSIPSLVGKPKLLLIQADYHHLEVTRQTDMLPPRKEGRYKVVKIPTDADILVVMSTVPRMTSHPASILVRAFSDTMEVNMGRVREEQADFLTLTVKINAMFEELFRQVSTADVEVPLPIVTSTLRKLLYL